MLGSAMTALILASAVHAHPHAHSADWESCCLGWQCRTCRQPLAPWDPQPFDYRTVFDYPWQMRSTRRMPAAPVFSPVEAVSEANAGAGLRQRPARTVVIRRPQREEVAAPHRALR